MIALGLGHEQRSSSLEEAQLDIRNGHRRGEEANKKYLDRYPLENATIITIHGFRLYSYEP